MTENLITTTVSTPLGPVRIFADRDAICGVYLPEHKRAPSLVAESRPDAPLLHLAADQLLEYFDGRRRDFDLPVRLGGTVFQAAVWSQLQRIPFGETRTYGELAAALGRPKASRAVGAANGRNPVSIIVPCHRVIGADGRLSGYAGGQAAKAWLLAHEVTSRDTNVTVSPQPGAPV